LRGGCGHDCGRAAAIAAVPFVYFCCTYDYFGMFAIVEVGRGRRTYYFFSVDITKEKYLMFAMILFGDLIWKRRNIYMR